MKLALPNWLREDRPTPFRAFLVRPSQFQMCLIRVTQKGVSRRSVPGLCEESSTQLVFYELALQRGSLMAMSDFLTLVGLVIGTVGAIVLTYDLFYKPGANFQAEVIKNKLQNMREFRAEIRAKMRAYPQPPYTPAEIQKFLDEEEAEWGTRERDLAQQDAEFLHKYEGRVQKLGGYGVLLIVIGFVFQIAGILVHSKEEKSKESRSHNEDGRGHQPETHNADLRFSHPRCVQPFPPGEDQSNPAETTIKTIAATMRDEVTHNHLMSVVFVGSVDKQPLSPEQRKKFKSNRGLAEARAVWVEERLRSFLPALPSNVVVLTSGPSVEAKTKSEKELDRFVAIYPVWQQEATNTVEESAEIGFRLRCETGINP
jgi:hypothetical protein